MQLQRRYNLPNCTLILDGLGDPSALGLEASQRLTILLNVECHLAGHEPVLSGGSVLFTQLVTAVSSYAQECLSGIPRPMPGESNLVRLTRKGDDLHQLEIFPENNDSILYATDNQATPSVATVRTVNLTTVQLFDLVEAIDQFFADPLALPDFTLALRPVPKGSGTTEPLSQRLLTPTVGLVGLVAAGVLLFNLPTPKVETPRELIPEGQASGAVGEPGEVPEPGAGEPSPGQSPVATDSPNPAQPSPGEGTDGAQALATALEEAPVIQDPQQLTTITATLFDRLNRAWTEKPTFDEALVYRVGVSGDSNVVGYREENWAAGAFVDQTPLPDLLYLPATDTNVPKEPLAEFRVVFEPSGKLEVSPWHGYPEAAPSPSPSPSSSPNPSPSPSPSGDQAQAATGGTLLTDRASLEEITPELYRQLDQNWKVSPTFVDRLTYQVTANSKGEILDYEAITAGADRFAAELPLKSLKTTQNSSDFGVFRVVFTPSGVLEVSPWDGVP